MIIQLLAVILLVSTIASSGAAEAPSKIEGPVELTLSRDIPRRLLDHKKVVLQNDGSFYWRIADTQNTFPNTSSYLEWRAIVPQSGRWSYVKTGSSSGLLSLGDVSYTLSFTSESEGNAGTSFIDYDFTISPSPKLETVINTSIRCSILPSGSASAGFVLSRGLTRLLVRAVGPGLRTFGVSSVILRPILTIRRASTGEVVMTATRWQESIDSISRVAAAVGAFPLQNSLSDAAVVVRLGSGAYVAQVTSEDPMESGEVLIEIYSI